MSTTIQVVIDCGDPGRLAEFWAAATGHQVQPPPPGHDSWPEFLQALGVPKDHWGDRSAVVDPDERGPRIFFQKVPEAKVGKNRLHLDLQVGAGLPPDQRPDVVTREVARLTDLGASTIQTFSEMGESWVVMRDPEGNEFCVS